MLTDERLMKKYGYFSPTAQQGMLIVEKHYENELRTLQQQNNMLIEGIDRISDRLMHYNPVYRSLQNLLKSIQGGSQ